MNDNLKEVKIDLDAQLPGGIESLEQMKKEKIDNLLGYEEYKKRFVGVHEQVDR